jgi:hypothetical protein
MRFFAVLPTLMNSSGSGSMIEIAVPTKIHKGIFVLILQIGYLVWKSEGTRFGVVLMMGLLNVGNLNKD